MTAPETPKAPGPCPTDEELAAFLDGMLPAAERARITAHLADCESCFEVFAGAIHFQQEAAGIEGGDRTVLPFVPRKTKLLRPWWWGSLAAVALLSIGLAFAGYRWYYAEPAVTVAELVETLEGNPELAKHLDLQVFRGPHEGGTVLPGPPAFMVGVYLVDLRVSFAVGQADTAANVLREICGFLKQIPFGEPDANQCGQDVLTLDRDGSPQTRRRIADAWRSKEADLDETLVPPIFAFGKWTEAGRLAAATRTPDFFASWRNRRFLRALLKDRAAIDEEDVPLLEKIRAVWERGRLQEPDYQVLAESFEEIIRTYRSKAEASDP